MEKVGRTSEDRMSAPAETCSPAVMSQDTAKWAAWQDVSKVLFQLLRWLMVEAHSADGGVDLLLSWAD